MYHCQVCGKGFDAQRKDAMYCSPNCCQKAYRQRRKAAKKAELYTLTMEEFGLLDTILLTARTDERISEAVYDLLALISRPRWYDALARIYLIAGASGSETIDMWARKQADELLKSRKRETA